MRIALQPCKNQRKTERASISLPVSEVSKEPVSRGAISVLRPHCREPTMMKTTIGNGWCRRTHVVVFAPYLRNPRALKEKIFNNLIIIKKNYNI